MDKTHASKIFIFDDLIDSRISKKPSQTSTKCTVDKDYDLFMHICELSASLGNFEHNVPNTVKFLSEYRAPNGNSFELVLLNYFRKRFEKQQNRSGPEEMGLHEARGNLFMHLYKELVDIEPMEEKRFQYLKLCYELFDYQQVGESLSNRIKLIDRWHTQLQKILQRLNEKDTSAHKSEIRVSESYLNMYLDIKNLEIKAKIESYLTLEAYAKQISSPLRGLCIEMGIAGGDLQTRKVESETCCEMSNRVKITGKLQIDRKNPKNHLEHAHGGYAMDPISEDVFYIELIPKLDVGRDSGDDFYKTSTMDSVKNEDLYTSNDSTYGDFSDTLSGSPEIRSRYELSEDGLNEDGNKMDILRDHSAISQNATSPTMDTIKNSEGSEDTIDQTHNENLKIIQNLFLEFNNRIETINEGCENSYSLSGALETPEGPSLTEKTKEPIDDHPSREFSQNSEHDDQVNLSPILRKIVQTMSDTTINVMRQVDHSLTEMSQHYEFVEKDQEDFLIQKIANKISSDRHGKLSPMLSQIKKSASEIKAKISMNLEKSMLAFLNESDQKSTGPLLSDKIKKAYLSHWFSQENGCNDKDDEPILNDLMQTVSDVKTNNLNEGKSLAENTQENTLSETESNRKSISSVKVVDIGNTGYIKQMLKWNHQRHIIAAPYVIVQLFKSKSSSVYQNGFNLYKQLNEFFDITVQKHFSPSLEPQIESEQGLILRRIRNGIPKDKSHPDVEAAVSKLMDRALKQRDPDLKDPCSPHHQKSISDLYMLVSLNHLGCLYRSLHERLEWLDRRGDTAEVLKLCLQKDLMSFYQFYELQKKNSCSLIRLYWQTRLYARRFQWLRNMLLKMNFKKSIVVSLYREEGRRVGAQRMLIQSWLNMTSKPLIAKLSRWLTTGHLSSLDAQEFPIERSTTSVIDEFWQKRYHLTESFSRFFDPQLSESIICVGKTIAYAKKYLGIKVNASLSGQDLHQKLLEIFEGFYLDGDQEPLYQLLYKLHSEVSGAVLGHLRGMKCGPQELFFQLHQFLMLADTNFCRELMDILEPVLEEPVCFYNTKQLNKMKDQMIRRPISDLYIDEAIAEGTHCWSRFLLRWKLPDYWKALMGVDVKKYEAIFPGLWRFQHANYVLCERIVRQQWHFKNRIGRKCFDGLDLVDDCLTKLINSFVHVMEVFKSYFLREVLEQAFAKLVQDLKDVETLDDLLEANRTYLKAIKIGSFQAKSSRKPHIYLTEIYNFIIDLDCLQQKFFRLSQILQDYVIEECGRNGLESPSNLCSDRMQEFRWSCDNTLEALGDLRRNFHLAMTDLMLSLHLGNRQSFRLLALKLDSKGYFQRKDERLWIVQRFVFKRKTMKLRSECSK